MNDSSGDRLGGHAKRGWVCVAAASVTLSLFAFGIVMGNVAVGAPRNPDENGWAHLFQLAMASQVPLMLLFLAMADWKRKQLVVALVTAQIGAAAAAFAALSWSGY